MQMIPKAADTSDARGATLWIALVIALAMLGSFGWACAAPLAAISALAALTLNRNEGLVLVGVTWFINQFVGYALLDYPHTFSSYAWGGAIGAGAVIGYFAARSIVSKAGTTAIAMSLAFLTAFVFYQVGMHLAASSFTNATNAFSTSIVSQVVTINAVAFVGFLVVHRIAVAFSLVKPARGMAAPATA